MDEDNDSQVRDLLIGRGPTMIPVLLAALEEAVCNRGRGSHPHPVSDQGA